MSYRNVYARLAGDNSYDVGRTPYPAGSRAHVCLWITRTNLWTNEVVQDLTSHMYGIDNGFVRGQF